MKWHRDSRNVSQLLAVSLAIVASLMLLSIPMYTQAKVTDGGLEQASYSTLLEVHGPSIGVPLLIPVVLTLIPLLMRGRAQTSVTAMATVALAGFIFIGSASIGWFYLPALAAAVAAVTVNKIGRSPSLKMRSAPTGPGEKGDHHDSGFDHRVHRRVRR